MQKFKRSFAIATFVFFFAVPLFSLSFSQEGENAIRESFKSYGVNQVPLLDCGLPGKPCCNIDEIGQLRDTLKKEGETPNLLGVITSAAGLVGEIPGLGYISKASQLVEKYNKIFNEIKNVDQDTNPPVCFLGAVQSIPDPSDGTCNCLSQEEYLATKKVVVKKIDEFCKKYSKNNDEEANNCFECVNQGGYFSALGCIYFQPERFILVNVFGTGLKLAGLFAFLCIIYSAIQIQLSQGNPEKIKAARERVTACIVGLLVVIFSVFILKIVGVDILSLPWIKTFRP